MRLIRTERCDTVELADGRRLAFTATGPVDGTPVVYCHGAIGTPIEATVDMQHLTHALGVRYIAPSRPGVGGSDPAPGRTVVDFADDIRQLADALALKRFSVVGVSAGGPYALGLAYRLRGRVGRVAVCSSLSPACAPHATPGMQRRLRLGLALLQQRPELVRVVGDRVLGSVARHPELINRVIAAHAAPAERERLAESGERAAASSSFLDATAAGVGGLIDDYLTYVNGWGFPVEEVYNEVHLWHGAADPLVPLEHALTLAASLPRCQVFIDADEGHHFFRSSLPQILRKLLSGAGQARPEAERASACTPPARPAWLHASR
jgi:pimeloyl-ACP methyl ester carboxylesterase